MLRELHERKRTQLLLGLMAGIVFGFLLQKGGATSYDVIMGQLLLRDFTVLKIMLTAIVTGSIGVRLLIEGGHARPHPKSGSLGSTIPGGLLFGIGFALLGYCPGTLAGAIGQGALDALIGGLPGLLLGAALFAEAYPIMERTILRSGDFGTITLPELLHVLTWRVIGTIAVTAIILFFLLEMVRL